MASNCSVERSIDRIESFKMDSLSDRIEVTMEDVEDSRILLKERVRRIFTGAAGTLLAAAVVMCGGVLCVNGGNIPSTSSILHCHLTVFKRTKPEVDRVNVVTEIRFVQGEEPSKLAPKSIDSAGPMYIVHTYIVSFAIFIYRFMYHIPYAYIDSFVCHMHIYFHVYVLCTHAHISLPLG